MERREALRTLGAVVTLPMVGPLAGPVVGGPGADGLLRRGYEARLAIEASGYRLQTLTPEQDAKVAAIAEVIIPETETPGARAAKVNEFVDLIVSEWFDEEERERFLNGLAAVDDACRRRFGVEFSECTRRERVDVVEHLDQEMFRLPDPSDHFFHPMKRLTLIGYFTSEVGMRDELNYRTVPGRYLGCAPREAS